MNEIDEFNEVSRINKSDSKVPVSTRLKCYRNRILKCKWHSINY